MTYSELPEIVQSIYMTNFEFFGKLFILIIGLIVCIYYLYYGRYQKKVDYILSDKIEILKLIFCKVFLYSFPLWIFILFPQVGIDKIIQPLIIIYGYILIPLLAIVLFIGILYYGTAWGLRFTGLDLGREGDKEVFKKLDSYIPKEGKFKLNIRKKFNK
jgi:hypothetical protein